MCTPMFLDDGTGTLMVSPRPLAPAPAVQRKVGVRKLALTLTRYSEGIPWTRYADRLVGLIR